MRTSAFGPVDIPPDFWASPAVTAALAKRDIGALFRLICERTGASQTRIGTATGIYQGRVSDIINGKQRVKTRKKVAEIADGLCMPAPARVALGLVPGPLSQSSSLAPAASGTTASALPSVHYPLTTQEAVAGAAELWQADDRRTPEALSALLDPAAWTSAALSWLVGQPDTTLPAIGLGLAIGRADVARVRASLELFAELDNRFGGAHARRSLIHFLNRDAAVLLSGRYTDEVGRELFAAVAEASLLAGWTSYDCGLHGLAQRYFIHALRLAQSAGDRRLACSLMSAMSHQATYLGHFPEAINLARAAREGLRDQATPALTSQFLAMEARALARAGDAHGCHTTLAAAERAFHVPEPGVDPEFIAYFNEAELAAEMAHCFRDLGDPAEATRCVALATPSNGEYARSDFFAGMVRAGALADQDDPEQACGAALDALHLAESVTSARCVTYVREFRQRLSRFGSTAAVRDFTEQAKGHALWVKAA